MSSGGARRDAPGHVGEFSPSITALASAASLRMANLVTTHFSSASPHRATSHPRASAGSPPPASAPAARCNSALGAGAVAADPLGSSSRWPLRAAGFMPTNLVSLLEVETSCHSPDSHGRTTNGGQSRQRRKDGVGHARSAGSSGRRSTASSIRYLEALSQVSNNSSSHLDGGSGSPSASGSKGRQNYVPVSSRAVPQTQVPDQLHRSPGTHRLSTSPISAHDVQVVRTRGGKSNPWSLTDPADRSDPPSDSPTPGPPVGTVVELQPPAQGVSPKRVKVPRVRTPPPAPATATKHASADAPYRRSAKAPRTDLAPSAGAHDGGRRLHCLQLWRDQRQQMESKREAVLSAARTPSPGRDRPVAHARWTHATRPVSASAAPVLGRGSAKAAAVATRVGRQRTSGVPATSATAPPAAAERRSSLPSQPRLEPRELHFSRVSSTTSEPSPLPAAAADSKDGPPLSETLPRRRAERPSDSRDASRSAESAAEPLPGVAEAHRSARTGLTLLERRELRLSGTASPSLQNSFSAASLSGTALSAALERSEGDKRRSAPTGLTLLERRELRLSGTLSSSSQSPIPATTLSGKDVPPLCPPSVPEKQISTGAAVTAVPATVADDSGASATAVEASEGDKRKSAATGLTLLERRELRLSGTLSSSSQSPTPATTLSGNDVPPLCAPPVPEKPTGPGAATVAAPAATRTDGSGGASAAPPKASLTAAAAAAPPPDTTTTTTAATVAEPLARRPPSAAGSGAALTPTQTGSSGVGSPLHSDRHTPLAAIPVAHLDELERGVSAMLQQFERDGAASGLRSGLRSGARAAAASQQPLSATSSGPATAARATLRMEADDDVVEGAGKAEGAASGASSGARASAGGASATRPSAQEAVRDASAAARPAERRGPSHRQWAPAAQAAASVEGPGAGEPPAAAAAAARTAAVPTSAEAPTSRSAAATAAGREGDAAKEEGKTGGAVVEVLVASREDDRRQRVSALLSQRRGSKLKDGEESTPLSTPPAPEAPLPTGADDAKPSTDSSTNSTTAAAATAAAASRYGRQSRGEEGSAVKNEGKMTGAVVEVLVASREDDRRQRVSALLSQRHRSKLKDEEESTPLLTPPAAETPPSANTSTNSTTTPSAVAAGSYSDRRQPQPVVVAGPTKETTRLKEPMAPRGTVHHVPRFDITKSSAAAERSTRTETDAPTPASDAPMPTAAPAPSHSGAASSTTTPHTRQDALLSKATEAAMGGSRSSDDNPPSTRTPPRPTIVSVLPSVSPLKPLRDIPLSELGTLEDSISAMLSYYAHPGRPGDAATLPPGAAPPPLVEEADDAQTSSDDEHEGEAALWYWCLDVECIPTVVPSCVSRLDFSALYAADDAELLQQSRLAAQPTPAAHPERERAQLLRHVASRQAPSATASDAPSEAAEAAPTAEERVVAVPLQKPTRRFTDTSDALDGGRGLERERRQRERASRVQELLLVCEEQRVRKRILLDEVDDSRLWREFKG